MSNNNNLQQIIVMTNMAILPTLFMQLMGKILLPINQYNANNDTTHTTYPSDVIVDYIYNNIGEVIEVGLSNTNNSREVLATNIT